MHDLLVVIPDQPLEREQARILYGFLAPLYDCAVRPLVLDRDADFTLAHFTGYHEAPTTLTHQRWVRAACRRIGAAMPEIRTLVRGEA